MEKEEKQKFFGSMVFPGLLLLTLWMVKLIEVGFQISFAEYGLQPQTLSGLRGILFSPFLHADWAHLSANSIPLFLLSAGLFYYYGKKAGTILLLSWFVTGLWVWIFARDTGIHIGASGVVYALASFHFTGGLLRREPRMMAFSLLVVFLYGGLLWGVIPDFYPGKNISWESHLLGGIAGIVLAFAYRGEGPQRKVYHWDESDEEIEYLEEDVPLQGETEESPDENIKKELGAEKSAGQPKINYVYKDL
jgi:membrane associated rhomboid family serine protease